MKPFNIMVYAVTLGCTATALASTVNENNLTEIPVRVSITVAAHALTAEWQPSTNLITDVITNGTTLGHIRLSQSATYAYRMANYTDTHYPSQGSLVKDDGSEAHILVVIASDDRQKKIEPSDHNGISGWTYHANTISALKLTLRNISTVSQGTYRGDVEILTISL